MRLMFEDREVYDIDNDIVLNKTFLPPYLHSVCTRETFREWLKRRATVLTRDQYKLLSNAVQFPDSSERNTALWLMLITRAISLEDRYWINDNKSWSDVNPLLNKKVDTLLPVALDEDMPKDLTFESVEYTTGGSARKAWKRESKGFYLYKSKRWEYEVLASQVLDALGMKHVHYEPAVLFGKSMCKCPCMSNEYLSRVPASDIRDTTPNFNKWVFDNFREDFMIMNIVDYLICNTDRHGQNWGFWMHNKTGELCGLHPLFDHNWSFSEVAMLHGSMSKIFADRSLREVALVFSKEIKLKCVKSKLPKFTELQADYFYKACEECCVEVL